MEQAAISSLAASLPSADGSAVRDVFAGAIWIARYSDGGIDAENNDGDFCSGRQERYGSELRRGDAIRVACSDGRTGTFLVEQIAEASSSGTLVFGKTREAATVLAKTSN